jgi:uncharacterized protein (DUF1330 family)
MPAYVVVDIVVRDRDAYERYKQMAAPAVAAYGDAIWCAAALPKPWKAPGLHLAW